MSYFTALPVPRHLAQTLQSLTPTIPSATNTHPDDFHLTLKYLGTPNPEALTQFITAISRTPLPEITLTLTHFEILTNRHASFLVARTNLPAPLHHLHQAHETAATTLGLEPYLFPNYLPHITLASFPPHSEIQLPTLPEDLTFTPTHITLYQSTQPHGTGVARYTPLQIL